MRTVCSSFIFMFVNICSYNNVIFLKLQIKMVVLMLKTMLFGYIVQITVLETNTSTTGCFFLFY